MKDDSENMMRLQVRLYREEDPKLFAALSAITPTMRARRIRQLLRNALLAEEGVIQDSSRSGREATTEAKFPASDKSLAAPSPAPTSDPFEQSNFDGHVSIIPGTHFPPRLLRVGNE